MKSYEFLTEASTAVVELKKGLLNAKKQGKKLDYDGVGNIMKVIWNKHDMTGQELHDVFVKEMGCTPDTWIKNKRI